MSETPAIDGAAPRAWEDLARSASRGADAAEPEAMRQLLCLGIDRSPYAVPVENVREIVRLRPITPIPRVTGPIRGVIALRGEIIQVIDLRLRLGLPAGEPNRTSRIVVVQVEDGRVAGLLVDDVREVLRVAEPSIGPAASGDAHGLVHALCARGAAFVSLLDLERVMEVGAHA